MCQSVAIRTYTDYQFLYKLMCQSVPWRTEHYGCHESSMQQLSPRPSELTEAWWQHAMHGIVVSFHYKLMGHLVRCKFQPVFELSWFHCFGAHLNRPNNTIKATTLSILVWFLSVTYGNVGLAELVLLQTVTNWWVIQFDNDIQHAEA